jgi:hypothetical protein
VSRIDEIRGRLHLLSRQEREDAVYLLDSLSTALGNGGGLRKELTELAEKWGRRVTLAEYDARMAGPGSTLVAVHKHTASSVRECKRELEALLAKGARL